MPASLNTSLQPLLSTDQEPRIDDLIAWFRTFSSTAVAFSGGVDSALVAWAAWQALGNHSVAITAHSPSVSAYDRELARKVAREIGIPHREIETHEIEQTGYRENSPRRCYFCKSELYHRLAEVLAAEPVAVAVNGTNRDDLGDYRPGLDAAREQNIRSPLVELGWSKEDVRRGAAAAGLSVSDRPASPCLSSRIAYGVEVTRERLARVEAAEALLRERGFLEFRVRLEARELARLEVPLSLIPRMCEPGIRESLVAEFKQLGFRAVTLDLEGFRSGSLNELVPLAIKNAKSADSQP